MARAAELVDALPNVEHLVIRITSETALAALIVWILVWSLALAIAGACQGCAVSHARPATDAGCVRIITCLSGAPPLGDCTVVECAHQPNGGDQ